MDRFLVVANQTLGSAALRAAIAERIGRGPCSFHVLVPATGARDLERLLALGADPLTGFAVNLGDLPADDHAARDRAAERLALQVEEIRSLGGTAEGEVGDPDPLLAIEKAAGAATYAEVLLSTLPAGASRWLSMDLPHRAARRTGLRVLHVEAGAAQR